MRAGAGGMSLGSILTLGGGGSTISVVQNGGGNFGGAPQTRAFGSNVTSGNKIIVLAAGYGFNTTRFSASNCTKNAGTATIGTVALLKEAQVDDPGAGGAETFKCAIWAADVTGTGSLTMEAASPSGPEIGIGIFEISSSGGWDAGYLENTASVENVTQATSISTGNMSSAGPAIFFGAAEFDFDAATITEDGNWTNIFERAGTGSNAGMSMIYRLTSTPLTDDASWGLSVSAPQCACGVVIKGVA